MLKISSRNLDSCLIQSQMTKNLLRPMDPFWSLLVILTIKGPLVATNFQSFGSKSDMNQDICLKFSAFVHLMFAQNLEKNFGRYSISLPATAHFGRNFECLQQLYLLRYSKKKKTGGVLDHIQLPYGRNLRYLQKNGVLKILEQVNCPGQFSGSWIKIQTHYGVEADKIITKAVTLHKYIAKILS